MDRWNDDNGTVEKHRWMFKVDIWLELEKSNQYTNVQYLYNINQTSLTHKNTGGI